MIINPEVRFSNDLVRLRKWNTKIYFQVHESLVLFASTSSDGSGEPAHMRSFARAFLARIYKV